MSASYAQDVSEDDCFVENNSFQDGEKLIYKLYYNWKFVWIPAGEITFEVFEEGDIYRIEGIGKSYPSYDNFFRVRDFYQTKMEKETLKPIEFVRHIEEGNYRKFDSLSFDQENLTVHSLNAKTKDAAEWEEYEINACMIDLLTVLYKLRNTDTDAYKPGDFLDLELFFDKEVFPIHVVYEKDEVKKIKDLGKFSTLKIRPELIVGNIFKEGDVMNIWVSKDANKLPLMIESPISVGSVKAVLKSYTGLKHEFGQVE